MGLLEGRYAGVCLALGADLAFVIMDAFVQLLELDHGVPAGQVLAYRMTMSTTLAIVILLSQSRQHEIRDALAGGNWSWWLYGLINAIQILVFYFSLLYEPLSDSVTIFHLRPLPVAILCSVFLGEVYRWHQGLACAVSFMGVILIARPQFLFSDNHPDDLPGSSSHWLGAVLACVTMILGGISMFLLRKIGDAASATILLLVYAVCCCILGFGEMLVTGIPLVSLTLAGWGMLVSMTIFGTLASVCFNLALQRETGLSIALLAYLQIVHSVVIQWLLYDTMPDLLGSVGMGVIVIAGVSSVVLNPEERGQSSMGDKDEEIQLRSSGDEEIMVGPPTRAGLYLPIPGEEDK